MRSMPGREELAVLKATLALAAREYLVYVHDGVTPSDIAHLRKLSAIQRLLKSQGIDVLNRAQLEEVARG